jgi:hypothetical protein
MIKEPFKPIEVDSLLNDKLKEEPVSMLSAEILGKNENQSKNLEVKHFFKFRNHQYTSQ